MYPGAREVPHEADFGQVAPLEHAAGHFVHDAGGRARRVLRIGGYDEDPGAACGRMRSSVSGIDGSP